MTKIEKGHLLKRLEILMKDLKEGRVFVGINSLNWIIGRIKSGDSLKKY